MRAADALARLAALPVAGLHTVAGPGPLLVLAPHPDDESLGCGGLIAQACAAGLDVHVAILTDGTMSHPNSAAFPAPRLRAVRETEATDAVAVLGVPAHRLHCLGYTDAAAPRWGSALRRAGDRLAGLIADRGIATILSSWEHDPHCDHTAAHRIAARACRLTGVRHLSYVVWGWTLPGDKRLAMGVPQGWRLPVAAQLAAKRAAIACHRSQTTAMIDDDPSGFVVPDHLLAACCTPFEVFLRRNRSA